MKIKIIVPIIILMAIFIASIDSSTAQVIVFGQEQLGESAIGFGESAIGFGESAIGLGENAIRFGESAIGLGENAIGLGENAIGLGENAIRLDLGEVLKQEQLGEVRVGEVPSVGCFMTNASGFNNTCT